MTNIYEKKMNTDIYINWYSHVLVVWKLGPLRDLIKRAITICSTPDAIKKEIKHLKKVFCEINQYPDNVVDNIIDNEIKKRNGTSEDVKQVERERTTRIEH